MKNPIARELRRPDGKWRSRKVESKRKKQNKSACRKKGKKWTVQNVTEPA